MRRAAILARVSDKTQAGDDRHSLPFQLDVMQSWAEREGWEVVATYRIPGESAFKAYLEDRPQFAAAISDALAGQFDTLIVYDVTRFARSQAVLHGTLRDLKAAGVRVMVATGEWDATADPMRAGLEGIIAESHSIQSSEKIRRGYARRFALGLPTGDVPFGYERTTVDQPPAIVPREAEAIRAAFRAYAAGAGYQAIAADWNAAGLRPRSKRGLTAFTVSAVQSVLENRFYAGFVTHRGEEGRGAHEPIVTEVEWERANRRTRRQTHVHTGTALLYGLPVCIECHGPIWSSSSGEKRHNYYFEPARVRGRTCTAAGRKWRTDQVDRLVADTVLTLQLRDEWLAYAQRQARKPADRGADRRRAELDAERKRIAELGRIGAYTVGEVEQHMARINRELTHLPQAEPSLILSAGERLSGMAEAWGYWTPAERNRACRTVLDAVHLDIPGRSLAIEPAPEFAALFGARADYVAAKASGTPDRTRTSILPPGLYTPADLGWAAA